jgi:hypothetical protein
MIMSKEELFRRHHEIFENLEDYALVKNPDGINSKVKIVYKPTMGFVVIEEFSEDVKELMVEKGVKIVDSEDEIRPPNFRPHQLIWDKEMNEWKKIYADEIDKIIEESAKKKGK